jgi:hypothetical protein
VHPETDGWRCVSSPLNDSSNQNLSRLATRCRSLAAKLFPQSFERAEVILDEFRRSQVKSADNTV